MKRKYGNVPEWDNEVIGGGAVAAVVIVAAVVVLAVLLVAWLLAPAVDVAAGTVCVWDGVLEDYPGTVTRQAISPEGLVIDVRYVVNEYICEVR